MPGAPKSEAFESVYAEHHATILAYLQRLTRRRDLAEELAQETFLRVGRGLDGFRGGSKITTWIYRIATNVYLDQYRKAPLPGHFPEESEGSPGEPSCVSGRSLSKLPDRLFEESEMGNCIREVIDGLPPDHRAAIVLHDLQGLPNKEVARILECSLDASKMRVHRARQRLRAHLAERCDFYHDEENVLRCDRKPPRGRCPS
jgi:RNA polymerase sigma-70 factor (ECF subfamily)